MARSDCQVFFVFLGRPSKTKPEQSLFWTWLSQTKNIFIFTPLSISVSVRMSGLSHLFHMICVEHLVVWVGRPVPAVLGVAIGLEGGGARPLGSTIPRRLHNAILSEIQRYKNVRLWRVDNINIRVTGPVTRFMIQVKRNVWTISPVSVYILIHYHASLAPSPDFNYLKCLAAGELLLLLWLLLLYTGL